MYKKHNIEVTAEDVFYALSDNLGDEEAQKKFDKLSDSDIDELLSYVEPSDLNYAIYNAYTHVASDDDSDDDEWDD